MKPKSLKRNPILLILLGALVGVGANQARLWAEEAGGGEAAIIAPGGLKFAALPNLPACATVATLRGDPTKGPASFLMKLKPGCKVPWHWHTPSESITVVSGTFHMEMKNETTPLLRPGGYVFMPGQHTHQGSCPTACTLFAAAEGIFDIHYIDTAGKEIPVAEALGNAKESGGNSLN